MRKRRGQGHSLMAFDKQKWFVVWLAIVGIGLAGCTGPGAALGTPTSTEQPMIEASAMPTILPTSTPALTQAKATNTPAPQPSLTATPTSAPTVIPTPLLTVKEPSAEQLASYVKVKPDNIRTEDVNGDGKTDLIVFERTSQIGFWQTWVWYADVNGDSETDLIVFEEPFVWIWIWAGDHYAEAFRSEQLHYSWAGINLRVLFEDWTEDEQPEVVVEYWGLAHPGPATWTDYWVRKIIHCQAIKCAQVWEGALAKYYSDAFWGGMSLYQTTLRATTDTIGRPAIRALATNFTLYCCESFSAPLNISSSIASVYSWNGSIFELTDKQVASVERTVESQSSLTALSKTEVAATVSAMKDDDSSLNATCQLHIADQAVGSPFRCIPDFTTVEWKDITGDGQEEAIVLALAAPYEPGKTDPEVVARCMHQRLIAFQGNANQATEIADIAGCVVREDLYGVSLQDFDSDDQLDILAAEPLSPKLAGCVGNCWYELNHRSQIYKWNGAQFVFWDDVPGP